MLLLANAMCQYLHVSLQWVIAKVIALQCIEV
jgi:hypothetical protein